MLKLRSDLVSVSVICGLKKNCIDCEKVYYIFVKLCRYTPFGILTALLYSANYISKHT